MNNPGTSASPSSPFEELERLKDRIITLFTSSDLDESAKSMWCGDAKELYYQVVNMHMMLAHGLDRQPLRGMLFAAASRCEQVASELRSVGKAGAQLLAELNQTFALCHAVIAAEIPEHKLPEQAPARVVRRSEEAYELPCSVCGKTAVSIHPAGSEEKILEGIISAGITRGVGLNPNHKDRVFGWLEKAALAALHHYLEGEADIEGGLDAYCPDCDRIYCRMHYNVREEWDEGFYDCSRGTCPQGHTRRIDD